MPAVMSLSGVCCDVASDMVIGDCGGGHAKGNDWRLCTVMYNRWRCYDEGRPVRVMMVMDGNNDF